MREPPDCWLGEAVVTQTVIITIILLLLLLLVIIIIIHLIITIVASEAVVTQIVGIHCGGCVSKQQDLKLLEAIARRCLEEGSVLADGVESAGGMAKMAEAASLSRLPLSVCPDAASKKDNNDNENNDNNHNDDHMTKHRI